MAGISSMELTARVQQIYRHLWSSYWFIPVAILLLSVSLAVLTLLLDQLVADDPSGGFLNLPPVQPETARTLLSMIAGSIIGVAGVVFSITMVAVSFASGTFGPRLIGNMMRDRGSQISLGIFIGTFVYTLITLRSVRAGSDSSDAAGEVLAFTPYISISTSMALAISCMGVLIYFIHHVPETINIELIVAKLGKTLKSEIEKRFPESDHPKPLRAEMQSWRDDADKEDATFIALRDDGYVQALDFDKICEIADAYDLNVEILARPGAFATECVPALAVWCKDSLPDEAVRSFRKCFAVGASPTVTQNIEFVADQLVEIIARALSPGMNDPYTAIACVNWLQVGFSHFAACEKLGDTFNRHPRVYSQSMLFGQFLNHVLDRATRYIKTDVNVLTHTVRALHQLMEMLPPGANRDVLEDRIRGLKHTVGGV